jgi:hypothetical protein
MCCKTLLPSKCWHDVLWAAAKSTLAWMCCGMLSPTRVSSLGVDAERWQKDEDLEQET